jgi:hypothetical protein
VVRSGLLPLLSCTLLACALEVSEVRESPEPGTLLTLRWHTDRPSTATVTYGAGDEVHTIEVPEARTAQEVHLVGLPPSAEARYAVTIEEDGRAVTTREGEWVTPNLPRSFPTSRSRATPATMPGGS